MIKIPLEGLLDGYESALSGLGYSVSTKLLFVRRADLIIRLHLRKGLEYLDSETLSRYAQGVDERYFNGELTRRHYESIRREIERFAAYAYTGEGRFAERNRKSSRNLKGLRRNFIPIRVGPFTNTSRGWRSGASRRERISFRSSFWTARRNFRPARFTTSGCI